MIASSTIDPYTEQLPAWYPVVAILLDVVLVVSVALYEILLIAKRGATIGKSVVGVRVVRMADGQVPGIGPAATR